MKDGGNAEQQADKKPNPQCEKQHAPINSCGIRFFTGVRTGHDAHESGSDNRRKGKSGGRSGHTENPALNQQLRHNPAALRTQSIAHGYLANAARSPKQQQRCHIDGTKANQQPGHAHQDHDGLLEIGTIWIKPLRIVEDFQMGLINESVLEPF